MQTWILVEKDQKILNHTLFVVSFNATTEHKKIENEFQENCILFTIGQRSADLFLMKPFRISGTMANKISLVTEVDLGNIERLNELLSECLNSWFGQFKSTTIM